MGDYLVMFYFIVWRSKIPVPAASSAIRGISTAPLMKQFAVRALCASTHAQMANYFMAELLPGTISDMHGHLYSSIKNSIIK
jgi:hypothetical protein